MDCACVDCVVVGGDVVGFVFMAVLVVGGYIVRCCWGYGAVGGR